MIKGIIKWWKKYQLNSIDCFLRLPRVVWGGGRDGDGRDGHDGHDEDQPRRRHCGSGARGSRFFANVRRQPSCLFQHIFKTKNGCSKLNCSSCFHSTFVHLRSLVFFVRKKHVCFGDETPTKIHNPPRHGKWHPKTPRQSATFFFCVATRFVVLSGQVSACSQEQKPFESFWTLQMFLPTFGYLYHQPEFLVRLKKVTSNFMKHFESQHFVTSSWSHSARWNDRPGPWSQARNQQKQKGFGQKYRLQRNTGNTM